VYRFVVCDLDGTVAMFDQTISPAVREATQAVVDAGLWFTICTGRGYQLLQPFLSSLVVNAPLICCNGGLIVEPTTRQVLYVQPMSLPLAHDLMRLAQKEGLEILVYLDDLETMLIYRPGEPGFVLERNGSVVRWIADPAAELTRPPHKLIFLAESPQATPTIVARIGQYVGDQARVMASSPRIVEVIMPGISKAQALSWVAEYLGVRREETIAIGDGDNDVEMLNWAALGIAMGNGSPAVRAAADWIAPPVEQDGVAVALRRLVLGSGESVEDSSKKG